MGKMGAARQGPTVALSNEMSDFMRASTIKCRVPTLGMAKIIKPQSKRSGDGRTGKLNLSVKFHRISQMATHESDWKLVITRENLIRIQKVPILLSLLSVLICEICGQNLFKISRFPLV